MHPLFGRRFFVVSTSTPRSGTGHVVVIYKEHMRLRIETEATQLVVQKHCLGTKLTLESVTELVTLATECEVLCPSNQAPSGVVLPQNSKKQSSKKSKASSVR